MVGIGIFDVCFDIYALWIDVLLAFALGRIIGLGIRQEIERGGAEA